MKYLVDWTCKLLVTACVWTVSAWAECLLAFLMWDKSYIERAEDGFDKIWGIKKK